MTRSKRAMLLSSQALVTVPVFAAAITILAASPASAQEQYRHANLPPSGDVSTTVVVTQSAPTSAVVVTPGVTLRARRDLGNRRRR